MAEGYMPDADPWAQKSKDLRDQLLKDVRKPDKRSSAKFKSAVIEKLKGLKGEYASAYMALHKKGPPESQSGSGQERISQRLPRCSTPEAYSH
jgi:hypothetical protein